MVLNRNVRPRPKPKPGNSALLEDFASVRKTIDGTQDLWSAYLTVNSDQTMTIDTVNHVFQIVVGGAVAPNGSGTSTGGNTASTLNDTNQAWAAGQFNTGPSGADWVDIIAGTGAGQVVRQVSGNSATQITMADNFSPVPDATSQYRVRWNSTYYPQFTPNGSTDRYTFPNGFAQTYIKSGTFSPNCNRLRFRIQTSNNVASVTPRTNLSIGNYVKSHGNPDANTQGQHYYWATSNRQVAGEWAYVFLDRQVQHLVGAPSNRNTTYDPEWNATTEPGQVHLFDGLTRFYCQMLLDKYGHDCTMRWTDFYFETTDESSEPIFNVQGANDPSPVKVKAVASVTVIYDPSLNGGQGGYELSWQCPINLTVGYKIAYKTSSMKAIGGGSSGWNTGTWDNTTVNNHGDDYSGTTWTSPALPRGNYWFGIQPVNNGSIVPNPNGYFTEVQYTP